MLLIFAEILLLALAPTQQISRTVDDQEPQHVKSLLQHFYEQYYNIPEEITERIARTDTEPVLSLKNVEKVTPQTGNNLRSASVLPRALADLPLETSPRMGGSGFLRTPVVLGRTVTVRPPMSAAIVAPLGTPQPRVDDDDFIFAPSTGRGNSGGTGWGERPIPNNWIAERCESPKVLLRSKCYSLLTQGPCASDEWVVEQNGFPQCAKTSCHWPKLPMNGKCYDYKTLTTTQFQNCPPGMSLTVNRDGTVECDCLPRYLFDARNGSCFEAFRQGPCSESQYIALVPERNARPGGGSSPTAACVNNPCKTDGMVCFGSRCSATNQRNCVALNSPCQNGNRLVMVDWKEVQLKCSDPENELRVIGNVPNFECSKGSKRDISGRCRKTTTMTFS